jgi:hypothetical protein
MAEEVSPEVRALADRLWEHAEKDRKGRVTIVLESAEDLARWMGELGKAARMEEDQ